MSSAYNRPLPTLRPWTREFWRAAANGRLLIQRGKKSGKLIMYPKKYSPHDYSEELEWVEASGRGTIYSYSVVHTNCPAVFAEDLPYVMAIVELDEGVRMCTNIVQTAFDRIRIGAPVRAVFKKVNDDVGLVQFAVV